MIGIALGLRIVEITRIDSRLVVRLIVGHRQLPEMIGGLERISLLSTFSIEQRTHPSLSRILEGVLNVVSTIGTGRCPATTSPPPVVLSVSVLMSSA